jgi:hypothetical protein
MLHKLAPKFSKSSFSSYLNGSTTASCLSRSNVIVWPSRVLFSDSKMRKLHGYIRLCCMQDIEHRPLCGSQVIQNSRSRGDRSCHMVV